MVLPGVAAFSRVCAYERPGTDIVLDGRLQMSRSDPVPMPRTAQSVVDDLHTLLHLTDVPGPYVLVGHSLGVLFVRLYASTYPDEVVGLVLVDAWSEALQGFLTPEQWDAYVHLNSAIPPAIAGDRDYETIAFAAAFAEMRRAATAQCRSSFSPTRNHSACRRMRSDSLPRCWSAPGRWLRTNWRHSCHMLSTSLRRRAVTNIQLQQPDLVIAAVREVVEAVHNPGSWGTPVASPIATPVKG